MRNDKSPEKQNGSYGPEMESNTWVPSLWWEDPLEEGMATHSSVLAWRLPRTEEPGGLVPARSEEERVVALE